MSDTSPPPTYKPPLQNAYQNLPTITKEPLRSNSVMAKIIFTAIIALTPIVAGAIVLYAKIQIHGYQIREAQTDIVWIENHLLTKDYYSEEEAAAYNDALLRRVQEVSYQIENLKLQVTMLQKDQKQ